MALKISRKKIVRVYNAHGLLKKIIVGNVRIKYQSYIFFSPLSMFHLLGEFKNHLSLFIFNKVAKYYMCWVLLVFSSDFPVWERVKHIVPVYNAHPSYKIKNLGKILRIIQP